MKQISLLQKGKKYLLFLLCCMLFRATGSSAQGPANQGFIFTPNGLLDSVFDQYGNSYQLKDIAVNDTLRSFSLDSVNNLTISTYDAGYFRLYLDKNCGMEHYATDSNHLARLLVISQMLKDLSQFINSPCSSTGQKINIWCRDIGEMSNTPQSSLGVVTSFYQIPLIAGLSGIADNTVWKTMNSGVDAYKNLVYPWNSDFLNGRSFFHAILAFNFNSGNISWNTDMTSSPISDASTYDLYTESLKQTMHALGFASLISGNGNSQLGATHPFYSRYDLNLKTTADSNLISRSYSGGTYSYSFGGSASVLSPSSTCYPDSTMCSTAIKYYGGLANPQAVYTPNCFEPGISLSHFEDACQPSGSSSNMANNQYFLMSNITDPGLLPGNTKRYPKPEERQVLKDIGYSVNKHFGDISNSHLNYIVYDTISPLPGVAGIADGMTNGTYSLTADASGSLVFSGNDLLGNDVGVSGGSFEGLKMIYGTGTFSVTSGNASTSITLSGAGDGINIFQYTPINSLGVRGNATWGPLGKTTSCPANSCIYDANYDLEAAASCGPMVYQTGGTTGLVTCWSAAMNTPDLYSHGCTGNGGSISGIPSWWTFNDPMTITMPTTPPSPPTGVTNNHMIGLYSDFYNQTTTSWQDEAIQVPLGTALQPGNTYSVSLFARPVLVVYGASSYTSGLPGTLGVAFSTGTLPLFGGYINSLPPQYQLNHYLPVPFNGTWVPLTVQVTVPTTSPALNNLVIYNAIYENAVTFPGYIYGSSDVSYIMVDNIMVQPQSGVHTFTPPSSIGSCSSPLTNLTQYVSGYSSISGGTFDGPGVTQTNNGTFNPSLVAGPLPTFVTITYTYTDNCGDVVTIGANVYVTASTPSLTASPNPYCPGSSVTLTATGCTTCIYSTGTATLCGSCGATYSVTPMGTTTYTVAPSGSACTGSVTVSPLTVGITNSGSLTVCAGVTGTILSASPSSSSNSYTWEINTGSGWTTYTPGNGQTSITASTSNSGTSAITTQYRVVMTANGCTVTSVPVTVTINPLPSAALAASPTTLCSSGTNYITLTPSPTGSYTYLYAINNGTSTSYTGPTANPSLNFYGPNGSYTAHVTVTNSITGCHFTSSDVSLTVKPKPNPVITMSVTCSGATLNSNAACATCTYQWYLAGNPITGATNPTYAAATNGSYAVQVTNNGCATLTNPVALTVGGGEGLCSPCYMFGSSTAYTLLNNTYGITASNSTTPTTTANNYYFVNGNTTISGSATVLTNAYFLVAPNVTITIAADAVVTMNGCHFWSCGTWNGIVVATNSSSGQTGRLALNNSEIENAVTGVTINNAVSSTALLLDAEGAVFNKDQNGISISNYPYNNIPFKISGSIFCNIASNNAPNNFMNLLPASSLNYIYNSTGLYTPPWYLTSTNISTTARGNYGIYLNGVGNTTGIMAIGDNNSLGTTNLFYNYAYGIYAVNSSMTLQNNGFANMSVDGVYASANSPCNVISVGVPGHFVNQFYNCALSCVEANGYNNFSGQNCVMIGGQPATTAKFGYNVTANSSALYSSPCPTPANVNISNNYVTNVGIGINLASTIGGTARYTTISPQSTITISGNTLQSDFGTPTGSHHMDKAINLSSSVLLGPGQLSPFQGSGGTATVSGNMIYYVYDGILATGLVAQTLATTNNNISLIQQSGSPTQYGISHFNCVNSGIKSNTISSATPQSKMTAVYVAGSQGSAVSCNITHDIGVGFDFYNQPPATSGLTWTGNSMQNELNGLYVFHNFIGQQGTAAHPAGNYWAPTPAWGGSNYQTYNDNASPAQSILYCYNSTTALPTTNNNGLPGNNTYSTHTGTLVSTNNLPLSCPLTKGGGGIGGGIGISGGGFSQGTLSTAAMEQVAQDSVAYGQDVNINRWMAQYALYQAMQGDVLYNDDSTLSYETPTDSSTILSTFYTMAQSSRFAYLSSIEYYLSTNSTDSAQALLANPVSGYVEMDGTTGVSITDVSDADYIVANYTKYYNIHLNYLDSTMSSGDSSDLVALTNLCPATNGDVVYKARALYTTLYNDVKVWEDGDLCSNDDLHGRMPSSVGTVHDRQQAYSLLPNPNNGHMNIVQASQDNNPVQAEVWNSEGQRLYSTKLLFKQKNARIDIGDAVPGIYLLQLTDSKGNNYALKFVVH